VRTLVRSALLLWFAAAGSLLAQTPPPCPCPEPPPPPPPLWFGKLNFSFLSTSGNTDTTSIGGAAEVNYNPKPWLFTFKGAYLYSATEGVTTAQATTLGLRASRDLTERLDVFVGAGYLKNTFSGINNLYSVDGGVGYKLFNTPTQFLRVEGGVGWTSEEDIVVGVVLPSRSYANARAALNYKWQFTKSAAFTNDFGFLADLDNTANWFITNKAAITADISSIFALQASWTLLYRNQPVIGFGNTDTATAVGIVAKF
jgi:putative salt-induced outer membrane protein